MLSKTSLPLLVTFITAVLRLLFKRRSLRFLRGPPSPSFLTGNEYEMQCQEQVGDLEFQWVKEYGTAYRTAGCLGEDVLNLADPRGLQHVMQGSGYRYPKSDANAQLSRLLLGSGLLSAGDEAHPRQRKAMNPAFTATQVRSYLPVFQATAAKLARKWTEDLVDGSKVIEISRPLASLALDALGEAAFKYEFGSLNNWKGSLAKTYDNLFVDINMNQHKLDLVFKSMWRYIPASVLSCVTLIPTRGFRRSQRFLKASMDTAKSILLNQTNDDQEGNGANDLFSLLARSTTSADPKIHMNDDEIQSQMATFMLAGHETTSSSITWALYELARHPGIQNTLREEISTARASLGQKRRADFIAADLDELPLLNAVIKETLRFHPIAPKILRAAAFDDIIPLSSPVQAKDGIMLQEVPIKKGVVIHIDIATYNRLPEIWGENANKWVPKRFMSTDADVTKIPASVGVYANLMTFSAGVRACIGWRFAVAEMQAVLAEMIEHFQFSMPSSEPDILRVPAGVMVPMIRDRVDMGVYMPLNVTLVES